MTLCNVSKPHISANLTKFNLKKKILLYFKRRNRPNEIKQFAWNQQWFRILGLGIITLDSGPPSSIITLLSLHYYCISFHLLFSFTTNVAKQHYIYQFWPKSKYQGKTSGSPQETGQQKLELHISETKEGLFSLVPKHTRGYQ